MTDRSLRCALMIFVLAASSALAVVPVQAQWRLDAQAGRLRYEAAPEAAATSLALGLARTTLLSDVGISAGVPFSADEPAWVALHGFRRLAAGDGLRFGVDLSASGFGYRIDSSDAPGALPPLVPGSDGDAVNGWGASLEAMPLVAWSGSMFAAEARAGGVHFITSVDGGERIDRTAFVTDAALVARPVAALALQLDGEWVSVKEGAFPYAGVGLTWTPGPTVWGSIGKWFDADATSLSWAAGASLPLGSRLTAVVNGRHDALDPIYGTPPRTTWGAGLSFRLGDDPAAIAEPIPASYEGGIATITLDGALADGMPSIAGDFNDWTPSPMTRRGDVWAYDVALSPGVYNYAFVDPTGEWFVPESTPGRRDDGMGGHVAVLVVEA